MIDRPSLADPVVLYAKLLVAYALHDAWSDRVGEYLDAAYDGTVDAYINWVQLAEVHHVLAGLVDSERVDAFVAHLERIGARTHGAESCWRRGAPFKRDNKPALGNVFTLATAADVDGTLLVSADDDFTPVDEVQIERFRS